MFSRATYKEGQPWEDIENPLGMPKYNGGNFFITVGPKGELKYFSRRKGVKGNFLERTQQLPQLTDKKLPELAGNVYNAELLHTGHHFVGTGDNASLAGILNSLPEKSLKTQEEKGPVRAVLLNVIHPEISTFKEKLEHLKQVEEAFGKPEILRAPYVKIGVKDIKELIDSSKKMSQEGVIITSLTKPESDNPRIKLKNFNSWNLKVSKINQEYDINGKPKESMGSLSVVDSSGKEVALVGTGFTKKQRKEIWENPKAWINKEIQVKGMLPIRNRIIAPVFAGNSDGDIDLVKSASTLEDQLLQNLVDKYSSKGVNMQKLLDDPLFAQLPLDKKVAFIEQANSPVTQPTRYSFSNIGTGIVGGGIGGAIAATKAGDMGGGWKPGTMSHGLVVAGLMGAAVGGLAGALRAYKDKSRDEATRQAAFKSGLTALMDRSGSAPIGSSSLSGGNRYINYLENVVDTKIGPLVHTTIGR